MMRHVCPQCGAVFHRERRNHMYCSRQCRDIVYRSQSEGPAAVEIPQRSLERCTQLAAQLVAEGLTAQRINQTRWG